MTISAFTHSLWFAQLTVGLFWIVGMRLSAATTDELEQMLVDAFLKSMHRAGLSLKGMAFSMRRGDQDTFDEAQLRRQLNRENGQHLSIFRLLGCPIAWWVFFGPDLMFIVFTKRWQEIKQEVDTIRADVIGTTKKMARAGL